MFTNSSLNKLYEQFKVRVSGGCLLNPSLKKLYEQFKVRVSKGCLLNPSLKNCMCIQGWALRILGKLIYSL